MASAHQQWHGKHHAGEAKEDQVVDRMDPHGTQGIDLFGHFHRADFRRHGRAHATGDHESGQNWPQLTAHRDGDDRTHRGFQAHPEKM